VYDIGDSKIQFFSGSLKGSNMFKILSPVAFCCNAGMFEDNFCKDPWPQLPEIKNVRISSGNHHEPAALQPRFPQWCYTPRRTLWKWDDHQHYSSDFLLKLHRFRYFPQFWHLSVPDFSDFFRRLIKVPPFFTILAPF